MTENRPESFTLAGTPDAPNNQALPVLVYRGVLREEHAEDPAAAFEYAFSSNGWKGLWRDGIYDYHHYHSNAHEALGIASGAATVELGGETGRVLDVKAGDLIVLPAGTAHQCLAASADLLVVGAYPPGQDWDICRSLEDCPNAAERVAAVKLPPADPFYGEHGPLLAEWMPKAEEEAA